MRVLHRLIPLALVAALVALSSPGLRADTRSDQARKELAALRQRIDAVRHKIAAGTDQRSDLSDALAKAQHQISAARERLDTLDADIADHRQRIDRLTRERDAEKQHLGDQLDALEAQVTSAYETGRVSRMRLLLSGESPERLGRMLAYYRYFSSAQSDAVNTLKTALARLAAKQSSLEAERDQLAARRQTRSATLDRLKSDERQQKQTLAALDRQLAGRRSSLSEMRDQAAQLTRLLDSVQDRLSDLPPVPQGVPFPRLKGRMHPPVSGQVLASFGQTKDGGPLRWQGEWLAADQGAPVHAVAGGRVVYVGYMKGYGLIVILDHGHGFYSLYGHAAASYVDVGDAVKTGQPIATAGHSGGHDRNGIYLEIRHGRTPVNPRHWLAG